MNRTLKDIINLIIDYLTQFLFLLMAVAVVMFVWYIIRYFIRPDADRKEAGNYVLYSVIGFFLILSLWGIVAILSNTFGLGNDLNQPGTWNSFQDIFPK